MAATRVTPRPRTQYRSHCCAASSFLAASPEWVRVRPADHLGGPCRTHPVRIYKRTAPVKSATHSASPTSAGDKPKRSHALSAHLFLRCSRWRALLRTSAPEPRLGRPASAVVLSAAAVMVALRAAQPPNFNGVPLPRHGTFFPSSFAVKQDLRAPVPVQR
jgi:hypothetical protein